MQQRVEGRMRGTAGREDGTQRSVTSLRGSLRAAPRESGASGMSPTYELSAMHPKDSLLLQQHRNGCGPRPPWRGSCRWVGLALDAKGGDPDASRPQTPVRWPTVALRCADGARPHLADAESGDGRGRSRQRAPARFALDQPARAAPGAHLVRSVRSIAAVAWACLRFLTAGGGGGVLPGRGAPRPGRVVPRVRTMASDPVDVVMSPADPGKATRRVRHPPTALGRARRAGRGLR